MDNAMSKKQLEIQLIMAEALLILHIRKVKALQQELAEYDSRHWQRGLERG
jgi:hypothetical protein